MGEQAKPTNLGRGHRDTTLALEVPEDPSDPLAGTLYRSLGWLGQGAMGLVLEAQHRSSGQRVVVKVLHAHLVGHGDLVDRMRFEARSLKALHGHPNIVAVADSGETRDGRPYFAMERLSGRTLWAERKALGTLPPTQAIDLACQALSGLAAAHAAGIVHRDVKPANLFVCDAPPGGRRVLKVLDFGIAKLLDRTGAGVTVPPRALATETNAVVGTLPYVAPEQALGGAVDARTDVYAMGAVLFHLLTGQTPFEHHTTSMALLTAHLTEAPRAPSELAGPHVPERLDRAVLRALAKDPRNRFPDARSFVEELLHVARGLSGPEPATPESAAAPVAPRDVQAYAPLPVQPAAPTALTLAAVWFASMAVTVALGLALTEIFR